MDRSILAEDSVNAFHEAFGSDVFYLACHAAVPVVLTPELLHFLRVNFFLEGKAQLPYTVEADILLSSLCNELGEGLYEIPPHIRDVLLAELVNTPAFGEQRIREIAILLLQYNQRFEPWDKNQPLERAQKLTALNLLNPQMARAWLAIAESSVESEHEWFIAMRAELSTLDRVLSEPQQIQADENPLPVVAAGGEYSSLPFPFNQQTFCRYEPVQATIEEARVLVVDNLLRDERDLSPLAREEWGELLAGELRRERLIAGMAIENILNNVSRLVKLPTTEVVHLSEVKTAADRFKPDAIVLSGTLRDFDYYKQESLDSFGQFIRETKIPVLGIGGGHQLVGLSFGARVVTLDKLEPYEQRTNRPIEYQYRFIRITQPADPIFQNIDAADPDAPARILRVWQNHGLQLDRVPEGFTLLATSYLCRNQMMVRRGEGQLIYTTQFHLEKSFEDWNKSRTRWEHPNESRDGRILFENFLKVAGLPPSKRTGFGKSDSATERDFLKNDAQISE